MVRNRGFLALYSFTLLVLLTGCTSKYFRDAGEPTPAAPRHDLGAWPFDEYWTGIIFNGNKIGFSHLSLRPVTSTADLFEIKSAAVMRFRFLMLGKKVNLNALDRVVNDLTLQSFNYHYDLDGHALSLSGEVTNGVLEVSIINAGRQQKQQIPIEGKLYPSSVIGLYPVFHGLKVGKRYQYDVYSGETQTVVQVNQEILAYEESDLFQGKAYKVKTRLHDYKVTTWLDEWGRPLLETSLGGVIIAGLETEESAKKYVVASALNKKDTLLDFSLIRVNIPIQDARNVKMMKIALEGIDSDLNVPRDDLQQCTRLEQALICDVRRPKPSSKNFSDTGTKRDSIHYLQSSVAVPTRHPVISNSAKDITREAATSLERITMLVEWIQKNIEREPVDVFSALDVFNGRKAECQGHAYLYTSFARSLKIPTRIVNGIVYSTDFNGFLYHTWAESFVNDRWIPVDPTFGQVVADATHLKLVEGESLADLSSLANVIGRIRVRVIAVETI